MVWSTEVSNGGATPDLESQAHTLYSIPNSSIILPFLSTTLYSFMATGLLDIRASALALSTPTLTKYSRFYPAV